MCSLSIGVTLIAAKLACTNSTMSASYALAGFVSPEPGSAGAVLLAIGVSLLFIASLRRRRRL
jgi:hypothetical protein